MIQFLANSCARHNTEGVYIKNTDSKSTAPVRLLLLKPHNYERRTRCRLIKLSFILLYFFTRGVAVYKNKNRCVFYTPIFRLSPAEPHFPILFPILVQSDRFIFLENRIHVVTPLQKSYC